MKHAMPALLAAMMALGAQQALAAAEPTSAPKAAPEKSSAKKAPAKKSRKAAEAAAEKEPDTTGATATDYKCALGDQVTLFQKPDDDKRIAIRWKKRMHELMRVDTTTGAHRFEDQKNGLVWIGIPAKSMLLDSKKGQQLANECKNPQQLAQESANG